jgi:hypothetical protein
MVAAAPSERCFQSMALQVLLLLMMMLMMMLLLLCLVAP